MIVLLIFYFPISQYSMCFVVRLLSKLNCMSIELVCVLVWVLVWVSFSSSIHIIRLQLFSHFIDGDVTYLILYGLYIVHRVVVDKIGHNARANRTQSSLFELLRCSRVSQIVKSRLGDLKMENSFFSFLRETCLSHFNLQIYNFFPISPKKHAIFIHFLMKMGFSKMGDFSAKRHLFQWKMATFSV